MYHGGLLETHWGPLEATQYVPLPLRAIGDSSSTEYTLLRAIGDR